MKLLLILTQFSILSFSYGLTFDEEVSSPALWSPHHIQLRKQWEQQEEELNNKDRFEVAKKEDKDKKDERITRDLSYQLQ